MILVTDSNTRLWAHNVDVYFPQSIDEWYHWVPNCDACEVVMFKGCRACETEGTDVTHRPCSNQTLPVANMLQRRGQNGTWGSGGNEV